MWYYAKAMWYYVSKIRHYIQTITYINNDYNFFVQKSILGVHSSKPRLL